MSLRQCLRGSHTLNDAAAVKSRVRRLWAQHQQGALSADELDHARARVRTDDFVAQRFDVAVMHRVNGTVPEKLSVGVRRTEQGRLRVTIEPDDTPPVPAAPRGGGALNRFKATAPEEGRQRGPSRNPRQP